MKRNKMQIDFDAISENESLARMVVTAFLAEMNPTLSEVDDVKTAVSEAVTNAIVHGYESQGESCGKQVHMECMRKGNILTVVVRDEGIGMENVLVAKQPFYTTKPEQNRAGMGFSFMEAFMDEIEVESVLGEYTQVTLYKQIGSTLAG